MAKRSDFEPRENDFYPTPFEALPSLIPYLRGIRFTVEGWQATPALDGTHHGELSVLMRRIERG